MIEWTQEERARVQEAIRRAETRTRAEIVCVVAQASSDYAALPHMWASFVALAVPWPLIVFTHLSVQAIFSIQLAAFVFSFALLSLQPLRLALVPRAFRRAQVHRAAAEQFVTRGIMRTSGRSGVLIYVSLGERSLRVLADEAVNDVVSKQEWQALVAATIADLREARLAQGLVTAIDRCGDLLAERLPDDGSPRNELPDRVYLV
jgi:putative membrane protein